jgi:ABC-type polysaccharide/polyol phosphate transport system ATPase subunit
MAESDASRFARARYPIDVRDLGIKYSLRYTRKTTFRTSFAGALRARGPRDFWALRNVTFRVTHGESLGVIGPNGAGKSTLLQAIAGIIQPSEGVVEVTGHISAMLHLQAGFDQALTGRDNIMLAGALMGIDHRVMEEREESIIDFADLGLYIDQPLKSYSMGMRARLGFAIATAVDPDILLLDEVVATGDEVFRAKSKVRVQEIVHAAKAVVLVTHDMNWITEFCTRTILLEKGAIVAEGEPERIVAMHIERSEQRQREKEAETARIMATAPKRPSPGAMPGASR